MFEQVQTSHLSIQTAGSLLLVTFFDYYFVVVWFCYQKLNSTLGTLEAAFFLDI